MAVAWMWVVAVVAGACGDAAREEPTPAASSSQAGVHDARPLDLARESPAVTAGAGRDDEERKSTPAVSPSTEVLRALPVLDRAKGKRAADAYRALLRRLCARPERARARIEKRFRLTDVDGPQLDPCESSSSRVEPLASGSLVEANADEVLLVVDSGGDEAEGARALALMRGDGSAYDLVRHLVAGETFEVRARFAAATGRDLLVLCNSSGRQGLYTGTCGLLGRGRFGDGRGDDRVEIETLLMTTCGPAAAIALERVTSAGAGFRFDVVVERQERQSGSDDDTDDYCSNAVTTYRKVFPLEYRLRGDRLERVTPLPKELLKVLAEHG